MVFSVIVTFVARIGFAATWESEPSIRLPVMFAYAIVGQRLSRLYLLCPILLDVGVGRGPHLRAGPGLIRALPRRVDHLILAYLELHAFSTLCTDRI